MKCIRCTKEISLLRPENEKKEDFKPESDMWDDGGVDDFIPNYGSRFDGEKFIVAICDDCLYESLVDNIIKYGNKKG